MILIRAAWACLCRVAFLLSLAASSVSIAVLGFQFPVPALIAAAWVRLQLSRRRQPADSHGTARPLSTTELLEAGMLTGDGLILGRVGPSPPPSLTEGMRMLCNPAIGPTLAVQGFLAASLDRRAMNNRLIRVRGVTHLSTVAPTGKGKGVSVLIPNLLAYRHSCIVFDPKGELFAATALHRNRRLGHDIYVLAPFGLGEGKAVANFFGRDGPQSDTYNPLSFLEADDPKLLDRCRDIGNQMVIRQGTENEPHWNDKAENVIGNLLYFICLLESRAHERNLESLCNIVSSPEKFRRAIDTMRKLPDPLLQDLGGNLAWLKDRELASAMSTVLRHIQWMQSPLVTASLRNSSFDPRDLRERSGTLYMILPAEFMTVMKPLLRIWIGNILRVITRRGAIESDPILFLIDEAAQLGGNMQAIEDAVRLYRGYGIRCWFFWQAQEQMRECFGERANVIAANMDVMQYFGIADYPTAEAISQRIGDATISVESTNWGWNRSRPTGTQGRNPQGGSISDSKGGNSSDTARRLYQASEITRLPKHQFLAFVDRNPVIAGWLVRWYADREFRWGGTGKQRGLGLAAGIIASFTLLVSIGLAILASRVPSTPQWAASSSHWRAPQQPFNAGQWYPQEMGDGPPLPSSWPYTDPQMYPPAYRRVVPPPWRQRRTWQQRRPYGF